MAKYLAEFFGMIGTDVTPPETFAELVPYLLTVFVGLCLVCAVFKALAAIVTTVISCSRKVG